MPTISQMRDLPPLVVGGHSREWLRNALRSQGVALNPFAEELLAREEMVIPRATLHLVILTAADLGFPDGATLDEVFTRAGERGLGLCPPPTGAYLRLVYDEIESHDPVLRRRRPPDGALHVASPIADPAFEVPKGFYLRTVDDQRWLRGYRCDEEYVIPAATTYVFARHPASR